MNALGEGWAQCDASGEVLDFDMVLSARRKEMEYVASRGVWSRMSRQQAQEEGYQMIDTKWIDIKQRGRGSNHRSGQDSLGASTGTRRISRPHRCLRGHRARRQ